MIDHNLIIKKIDEVLYLTRDAIVKDRRETISSCAYCGEWHIAFEILCSNLYEYKSPISRQAYNLLKDIGISLNIEKKEWEILKSQIHLNDN